MPRKRITLADVDPHVAALEEAQKELSVVEDEVVVEKEEVTEGELGFPPTAFDMTQEVCDAMVLRGNRRGQSTHKAIVFHGDGIQPLFALNLAIVLLRDGGVLYFPSGFKGAVEGYPFMEVTKEPAPKGYKQAIKKID